MDRVVIDNILRKIELLETRFNNQVINSGEGLLSSRDGDHFNIYLAGSKDQSVYYHPWKIQIEEEENTNKFSIYGGTVNGIMPDNWKDFYEVSNKNDNNYFVWWEAQYSGQKITQLKVKVAKEAPELSQSYVKNALPDKISRLIGIISKNQVLYQFAKTNFSAVPTLRMEIDRGIDGKDYYYDIDVTEL